MEKCTPSLLTLLPSPHNEGRAFTAALVGGGGKTSLLFALAALLRAQGHSVITCTTTKIFVPTNAQSPCLLLKPSDAEVDIALLKHGHVSIAQRLLPQDKVLGMPPEYVDQLAQRHAADYILVEADGSAGLPLKAAAAHEPPVPPCADICLALWNVAGLGQQARDAIHRPERALALCDIGPTHNVTPEHVAHLLLHPEGLFRTTPPHTRQAVLGVAPLNQCDRVKEVARCAAALYPHSKALWWACAPQEGWARPL